MQKIKKSKRDAEQKFGKAVDFLHFLKKFTIISLIILLIFLPLNIKTLNTVNALDEALYNITQDSLTINYVKNDEFITGLSESWYFKDALIHTCEGYLYTKLLFYNMIELENESEPNYAVYYDTLREIYARSIETEDGYLNFLALSQLFPLSIIWLIIMIFLNMFGWGRYIIRKP